MGNNKTYLVPVSNGIKEHYGKIKDAMWLLFAYIDWTTEESIDAEGNRFGLVLGGRPMDDAYVASTFGGCSRRTARRWRRMLAKLGYIHQKRTPIGYVITVNRSKKWNKRVAKDGHSDMSDVTDHSECERPNGDNRAPQRGHPI